MNLYNLHKDPKSLHKHDEAHDTIPDLIKEKMDKGETLNDKQLQVVLKNPTFAYQYAKDVIEGPWPKGEKTIAKGPRTAIGYAKFMLRGRFPEGEKAIATVPGFAYAYAMQVIRGRFPEGEKAIATSAADSIEYARYVIKDRWPPGEDAIASNKFALKVYNELLHRKGYDDVIEFKPSDKFKQPDMRGSV